MEKILIIAAHPDDEVLGCGGTITRLVQEGKEVHILILTDGFSSRTEFYTSKKVELLKQHHKYALEAGSLMGVSEVKVLGFPDQKMDTLPILDIIQAIELEIKRIQPDTIFTHHGGDLNQDHVISYRATLTATRPMVGECVRSLYAYEVPSSTEWSFQRFSPYFKPSVFFNISNTLETKISAMEVYKSEVRNFPHPRSSEALRAIAQRWGSVVGFNAAEAFELIREIK
jgi:LmbE family N-acetylglucosaminyl deacetylase